jgi:hypothetical protein
VDDDHVVGDDLARLGLAFARVLHEQFIENVDVVARGLHEGKALQGDLALGCLGSRFHEMLRRQATEILLRGLVVADVTQGAGFFVFHHGSP